MTLINNFSIMGNILLIIIYVSSQELKAHEEKLNSFVKLSVALLYKHEKDCTGPAALPFPCIYLVPNLINPDVVLREVLALGCVCIV